MPHPVTATVFYSWQSDLPDETNRALIREALREASTSVEVDARIAVTQIKLDEATRNVSGSPDIAHTIFEKIREADVFVADVTTVIRQESGRSSPNPNVLVELGYAAAHLGWERIVIVFNSAHGNFDKDAPFDIEHNRVLKYDVSASALQPSGTRKAKAKLVKEAKKQLFDGMCNALSLIVSLAPQRPFEVHGISVEARKRQHDVEVLWTMFSLLHVPTVDEFLNEIRDGRVPKRVFPFLEGLQSILASSLFHIYDETLAGLTSEFARCFSASLAFGEHFEPAPGTDYYLFVHSTEDDVWERQQAVADETRKALRALLKDIRDRFPEFALDEATNVAWTESERIVEAIRGAMAS